MSQFYLEVSDQRQRALIMTKVTSRSLMSHTWRGLGEPPVGAKELRQIQRALEKELGPGGVQSPAAIARVLADEGAELVHPEVIESDAQWRAKQLRQQSRRFEGIESILANEELQLEHASELLSRLEELRLRLFSENDADSLAYLRAATVRARESAEQRSRSATDKTKQLEQLEIAEWIKVWLQTPKLFADWLELRKRSPEFRRRFAGHSD